MSTALYTYDPNKCDGHYRPGDCDECPLRHWGRLPCRKETFIQGAKIGLCYYVESRYGMLISAKLSCIFRDETYPNGAYRFKRGGFEFLYSADDYNKTWRVWGETYMDEPDEEDMECAPWLT